MPAVVEPLVQPGPAQVPAKTTARYATLMVHAEPHLAATQRVEFAARLARELDARLIGVAAQCLTPFLVNDPAAGYAPDQRIAVLVRDLQADLKAADEAFRRDTAGADVELRTIEEAPAAALAEAARAADLIVVSPKASARNYREADPGEVVVRTGKPVLIVPPHAHRLDLDTIVVAWKDSRECRRAVAAALPFLQRARRVVIRGVCDDGLAGTVGPQLADVVGMLERHGVRAESEIGPSDGGVAKTLMRTMSRHDADLLVMGAYGHTRATELVFGGVTEHFLRRPACCVLMAH